DLWFQESEYNNLLTSIYTAGEVQLPKGQLADCQLFVDGYWPSFLRRHVPLADPQPKSPAATTVARPTRSVMPSITSRLRLPSSKPATAPATAPPAAAPPAEASKQPPAEARERSWWPSWLKR